MRFIWDTSFMLLLLFCLFLSFGDFRSPRNCWKNISNCSARSIHSQCTWKWAIALDSSSSIVNIVRRRLYETNITMSADFGSKWPRLTRGISHEERMRRRSQKTMKRPSKANRPTPRVARFKSKIWMTIVSLTYLIGWTVLIWAQFIKRAHGSKHWPVMCSVENTRPSIWPCRICLVTAMLERANWLYFRFGICSKRMDHTFKSFMLPHCHSNKKNEIAFWIWLPATAKHSNHSVWPDFISRYWPYYINRFS